MDVRVECRWCEWTVTIPARLLTAPDPVDPDLIHREHYERDHPSLLPLVEGAA